MWQTLAKTRDSGDQHVLILHLLNAAPDYTFFTDDALKTPPPMRNLKLTLLLPPDSKILNAFDLSPLRGLNPTPLPPTITGGGCQIPVPEVRFYDIVVVTFTAAKGLS